MAGFEQLVPFALVAGLTFASLAVTLRNALPAIAALRRDMAECPQTRELRFTVRELRYTSRVNVIELPVRVRNQALRHGPRAAA